MRLPLTILVLFMASSALAGSTPDSTRMKLRDDSLSEDLQKTLRKPFTMEDVKTRVSDRNGPVACRVARIPKAPDQGQLAVSVPGGRESAAMAVGQDAEGNWGSKPVEGPVGMLDGPEVAVTFPIHNDAPVTDAMKRGEAEILDAASRYGFDKDQIFLLRFALAGCIHQRLTLRSVQDDLGLQGAHAFEALLEEHTGFEGQLQLL